MKNRKDRKAVRIKGSQTAVLDNLTIYHTQGPSIDCLGVKENIKMTNCTVKYAEIGNERSDLGGPDGNPYKVGCELVRK